MRNTIILIFTLFFCTISYAQVKTIHVFVALCDNEFQGIVPVPKIIGNGKDPKNNLYWGAAYGVKNYFTNKTTEWKFVCNIPVEDPMILERALFQHRTKDAYLLADAYDGEKIKNCTENFLKSANGQLPVPIKKVSLSLTFGGQADLIAYIGHDGLMDFSVQVNYYPVAEKKRDVIILACYSKRYFFPEIKKADANPILWSTHLMSPEAYTLSAALDGWILKESNAQVEERAAQAYNKYQKCGMKGARNLLTTGF